MKHVGFTGTQNGMTTKQAIELVKLLSKLDGEGYSHFHHGDCVGADSEAHDIATGVGYLLYIHPPDRDEKRAFRVGFASFKPKPYLVRNREIVDSTDVLIATPKHDYEELRSGTWSTVRYARKLKRKVYILNP